MELSSTKLKKLIFFLKTIFLGKDEKQQFHAFRDEYWSGCLLLLKINLYI